MSLVAHEFYTSLSKYVITNCVFDRWMDDCTERADYKPHSFSRLFTAVYLAHNIETVKCNQHKVIFALEMSMQGPVQPQSHLNFQIYLNPIQTNGQPLQRFHQNFPSRYIRYTCRNVYGAKISVPKCLLHKF